MANSVGVRRPAVDGQRLHISHWLAGRNVGCVGFQPFLSNSNRSSLEGTGTDGVETLA